MPSSPEPLTGLELQAQGEGTNVWGAPKLNTALSTLAQCIRGRAAIAVNASVVLTSQIYQSGQQAGQAWLDLSGAGGFTITVPSRVGWWIVRNGCPADVTFSAGGATASVKAGAWALIVCDGASVFAFIDGPTLLQAKAYTDATAFAMISGQFPGQTGNAGSFLKTDGASPSWAAIAIADVVGLAAQLAAINTVAAADRVTARRRAISYAQQF